MQEFVILPDGKLVCFNPGGRWHGWLFSRSANGNLVSERQLRFSDMASLFKDPLFEEWRKLYEAGRTRAGNDISGI